MTNATRERMSLEYVLRLWGDIRDCLAPDCERLQIAGSARRRRPEVKDLEIVAIPRFQEIQDDNDLYRRPMVVNCLKDHLDKMVAIGLIAPAKSGNRYMAFDWMNTGLRVDLFTATEETWPLVYMVRTGPAAFNMMILKKARARGYRILWGTGIFHDKDITPTRKGPRPRTGAAAIPVETEADIFNLLGMDYIPPEERNACQTR